LKVLGANPGIGHAREDLTHLPVKFWPVYSYLIVYDPETRPVQILRVLHGMRDVEEILNLLSTRRKQQKEQSANHPNAANPETQAQRTTALVRSPIRSRLGVISARLRRGLRIPHGCGGVECVCEPDRLPVRFHNRFNETEPQRKHTNVQGQCREWWSAMHRH